MTPASRKLLIIDDDVLVRQSIVTYLTDSGFCVCSASDATAALELLANPDLSLPDLIITDLRMPNGDGLQLLQLLHDRHPSLPVIVISGAGVMNDVVTSLRLGARDYLIKPVVDLEVLVHSINKVLDRQDLEEENKRYRVQLENANRELKENLRVLERDQIAGRRVQRRLMPSGFTTEEGYTAAHTIVPSLFLSGDFVDYAHIKRRYLAFYLADVSGHGASSAFVTIWLKHLVSRMVREEGLFGDESSFAQGADLMLRQINRELHETRLSHHLTLFVGVIDTVTHKMHYVVAGHLPMPILLTDEGAEYLTGRGKPVGIFKEVSWEVYERQLPEKFALVCFSDGILETLSQQELQEKEAQLLKLIASSSGGLDSVCNTLVIKEIRDNPDDIAVLSITRGVS
ncbi:PP2C family protein-serine/threonine phosphatase [Cellvibrio sp. OA-2007]|uniref:PP2C family protein-serine/threonine phosphatase n=1 Tax=Cellvibrio sp. OA-2007 TaxID=529823 RepID=UPI0007855240|nr:SpoIIE family protein phosphatase [Cellvibrio sp. OA-2007]